MRGGKLRHRLRYEEASGSADSYGQPSTSWSTVIDLVWGDVRTPRGQEVLRVQAFNASVDHLIRVRKPLAPIRPGGRLVDLDAQAGTGGVYQVVAAVDDDGRREALTVYTAELV